jgi:hypothetical protein
MSSSISFATKKFQPFGSVLQIIFPLLFTKNAESRIPNWRPIGGIDIMKPPNTLSICLVEVVLRSLRSKIIFPLFFLQKMPSLASPIEDQLVVSSF